MSEIHCRQLCKTFQQGDETITGLDHVDLDIEAGEFLCLSGPSGSGKTTLLNAIGGLDTPDSGEISMGDIRIDQLELRVCKRQLHRHQRQPLPEEPVATTSVRETIWRRLSLQVPRETCALRVKKCSALWSLNSVSIPRKKRSR